MKFIIALILSLTPITSYAAQSLDAIVGVGMGKSVLKVFGDGAFERFGTLGIRYGGTWKIQGNGGYWFAPAPGDRSSPFASLQGGLEVVGDGGSFAQVMFGPAWIGQDDQKLSGHFQFHLTTGAGIKSDSGYSIAMTWVHLSNAGIRQPNMGRDLWTLQLGIPLWKSE